jgi:hypothetical protein
MVHRLTVFSCLGNLQFGTASMKQQRAAAAEDDCRPKRPNNAAAATK